MYKGEGSIPAMPEAKSVTATIHNIYDVSSSRYARTLHQAANLAGAPKGFHGFKTEPLTIGNAIQFTSIGSPAEAGGPATGSFALTIDERLARAEGISWTGDHGWSDRIVSIIAKKATLATADASETATAARPAAPPATPGAAESSLYYPHSARKPLPADARGRLQGRPKCH